MDYYALLGAKVAAMTGYSVGLSACKKEGKEKLRWLNIVLGAKALEAITRAGASPVRRFQNRRCSRTSPLYGNEADKKYDAINATHSDYVVLLSDNSPTFTPLWNITGYHPHCTYPQGDLQPRAYYDNAPFKFAEAVFRKYEECTSPTAPQASPSPDADETADADETTDTNNPAADSGSL